MPNSAFSTNICTFVDDGCGVNNNCWMNCHLYVTRGMQSKLSLSISLIEYNVMLLASGVLLIVNRILIRLRRHFLKMLALDDSFLISSHEESSWIYKTNTITVAENRKPKPSHFLQIATGLDTIIHSPEVVSKRTHGPAIKMLLPVNNNPKKLKRILKIVNQFVQNRNGYHFRDSIFIDISVNQRQ